MERHNTRLMRSEVMREERSSSDHLSSAATATDTTVHLRLRLEASAATDTRRVHGEQTYFAWSVTAWADCCEYGDDGGLKLRTLICSNIFEGVAVDESHCHGMAKPSVQKRCSCREEPCKPCDNTVTAENTHRADPEPSAHFLRVGCMSETSFGKYFPWYHESVPSVDSCGKFCISKGFDVAGFRAEAGHTEVNCSCGASVLNKNAFHRSHFAQAKLPVRWNAVIDTYHATAHCKGPSISLYQGWYTDGGVPPQLLKLTVDDAMYQHTIIEGVNITEEDEEDGFLNPADGGSLLEHQSRANSSQRVALEQRRHERKEADGRRNQVREPEGHNRDCYPDRCGAGWAWPISTNPAKPFEDSAEFAHYTRIKYYFDPAILHDTTRKEVFREAAKKWRSVTCVNLMEVTSRPSGEPHIRVGVDDYQSCYAMGIGQPRSNGEVMINLGRCHSMQEFGSVVHEIGHALGLNHEQKRPDAAESFQGHGPYLHMHWNNIPETWVPQFTGDRNSYTGSTIQSPVDPVGGFAPYDYGSIMHYGNSLGSATSFDPLAMPRGTVLGQRNELSSGDISQVNDQQQCVKHMDLIPLNVVHQNATTHVTALLSQCQGSCGSNADCAQNLVCWVRQADNAESVPGCSGHGGGSNQGVSFCVRSDHPAVVSSEASSSSSSGGVIHNGAVGSTRSLGATVMFAMFFSHALAPMRVALECTPGCTS